MSLERTVRMAGPAIVGGVSTAGNTAGSTGSVSGTVVFAGMGGITASQSTNGSGATISMSAKPSFSAGVSTGGNTAGSTGVSGTRVVFVGAGANSLSQATDAAGATITISGPSDATISMYAPQNPLLMGVTQGIGASGATQTTVTAFVMPMVLPQALAFNNLNLAVHNSFSSATTSISSVNYSYSMGASLGFYSLNASTMSLVSSFSGSLGLTNASSTNVTDMKVTARVGMGGSSTTFAITGGANMTSIMSSINSVRRMGLMWTTQGATLTAGQYWAVGCFSQLTGGAAQASLTSIGFESVRSAMGSAFDPPLLAKSTASMTSPFPFLGQATLVNSSNSLMPVSFATSVITTATAIANSTKFQSLFVQAYSSHSN